MLRLTSLAAPLSFGAALILSLPVSGQVPDGWIVVSSFRTTDTPSTDFPFIGDGGIWLCHPTAPAAPIPISGLGSDLTGAGAAATNQGANCVLRRPDGSLLVGETTGPFDQVDLHLITLSGSVAASDVQFPLGTGGLQGGRITQMALLPSGEVLMTVFAIGSGPLAGAKLGRVNLESGVVTPVPAAGMPASTNAVALDPSGTLAYVATTSPARLWSVPVPDGGTATLIAVLPTNPLSIALDNDGQILVGGFFPPTDLHKVDPATGAVTFVGVGTGVYNAVAVERVTGSYLISEDEVTFAGPSSTRLSRVDHTPSGVSVTQLSILPPSGWGVVSGIDVNHNPETFGLASPGASTYTWALAPNPGGLPLLGSSSFSLTLESSPASGAPGVALVCLGAFDPPLGVLGVLLNVDVTKTVVTKPLLGLPVETIPLPIPSVPALAGIEVFVQSGHLEPGGLAASSGVRLTILI